MLKDFSSDKFDIIIQAGQSNSEGYGFGPVTEPFSPTEDIYYLDSNFTISIAREHIFGNDVASNFSLKFCLEYIKVKKLTPGRKILVIRSAVGGTGFLDNHWKLEDDLFLRMMEMIENALSLNPENKLVALLWHQGETDAVLGASREIHFDNLSKLVNTVRNTFKYPTLPFIAGDFVHHWKNQNSQICEPVVTAIREVCDSIGYAGFVTTENLKSNDEQIGNGDNIHFSRQSLYDLGKRYFNTYIALEKI